jgi:uncharacterized GH25 family protein/5-hydroxyisourate hydrolase-like protein (transthyretin family)
VSNVAKIAVPLLLLAAIGGGVFYFANQSDHGTPPVPVTPSQPQPPVEQPPAPVKPAAADPAEPQPAERVKPTSSGNADAAQGVRGRVLLPTGGPAARVPVMLIESATNNPIEMFLVNASGRTKPPLVMSQTADDGTFALGLPQAGKAVDLRVVSAEHPEFNQPQIKVAAGDWYNAPDITLSVGLVVYGRVMDSSTKAPITNATVYMASSHQTHTMMATPGRERGTPATTDASGAFRFVNAPKVGLVNLVAEAPGYASTQQLNKQLSAEHPTEVNLELEVGQPIAGVVVDGEGKPIPGAKINATGLSAKTPQSASAATDDDGAFAFPTLRPGPYHLVASSPRFAEVKVPLVLTGETDVKVVMSTKGSVKLRVLAANGAPLKSYRLSLKRNHPGNQMGIGNVMDYADRSVTPADYPADFGREWAVLRGLPSGEFRWQITEGAHAKTLSPPFTIVEGGPPVEVQATLTMGGVLFGTVIDDRGQPVVGATVTTDMNGGIAADTGFLEIFRSMIPEKHTRSSDRTDSQGKFRITKLAFADYMVRAQHPDYCEGTAINLKLEGEGQQVDAGVIQLARGAIVEGVTLVDGMPTGQVKVNLSVPFTAQALPEPQAPGSAPNTQQRVLFNAQVLSDGEGRFRLLKRVPPGTYKATASRSGENPFEPLMDLKATERQVVVAPGQDVVHLEFTLPKR